MNKRGTTVWVQRSTHERLRQSKPDVLTYDEFILALLDKYDAEYQLQVSQSD